MNPAIMISIGALIISFFSLIFTAKTYKKNSRLAFLQRRDHLSQRISDLNSRNTEAHLISARFELVAVKNALLPLRGEEVEINTALIASIKKLRDGVENGMKLWDENIETFHFKYKNLTLETDAPEVERMITIVQVASDNLKNCNDGYTSSLHILETTNEIMKTTLAELDEKNRQINIDFERAMEKIKVGYK